jgi:hypothetical protein
LGVVGYGDRKRLRERERGMEGERAAEEGRGVTGVDRTEMGWVGIGEGKRGRLRGNREKGTGERKGCRRERGNEKGLRVCFFIYLFFFFSFFSDFLQCRTIFFLYFNLNYFSNIE